MNETRTTQPFGPFFPVIFTVARWICRLLHPVTVQGLENLPRHGALLVANHASNWDPLVLATALPKPELPRHQLHKSSWTCCVCYKSTCDPSS